MKPLLLSFLTALFFSSTVHAAGLTCKELTTLSFQAAQLRAQGQAYETVMSLVGGADKYLDAAIKDIYVLRLTPDQAVNHVSGLCEIASRKAKGK